MMGPSAIGAQPPPEDLGDEWDEEGDEPFCNCGSGHGIEETDWNHCDCCGKPIYDEAPECTTCCGTGTIDERLGGEWNSNPKAKCPDCDGTGELRHNVELTGASRNGEASSPQGGRG